MGGLMAMNPQRQPNKGRVCVADMNNYDTLIRQQWLADMVDGIRRLATPVEGETDEEAESRRKECDKLKGELPFRCAHYARFKNDHRAQKAAEADSFLFQTTVDVDDADMVERALRRARELDNEEGGAWQGALLHLEYSARKKLHIDIRMPIGMTIEETQRRYAAALGVEYDASCTSRERIIYITDVRQEIYRSSGWYAAPQGEELEARRTAFKKRGLTMDGQRNEERRMKNEESKGSEELIKDKKNDGDNNIFPDTHKSVGDLDVGQDKVNGDGASLTGDGARTVSTARTTRKNLIAFDLCREEAGLKDVDINREGSRHTSLQAIMSVGAARLMNEDELKAVVGVKMAEYARERDCQQLIHDFYEKYHDDSKLFNITVQRINAMAEKTVTENGELGVGNYDTIDWDEDDCGESARDYEGDTMADRGDTDIHGGGARHCVSTKDSGGKKNRQRYIINAQLKKKLPMGLKESLAGVPDSMVMPVLCAVMPIAAAYADMVETEYCDGKRQPLALMSVIVGEQASGKSACKDAVDVWLRQMRDEDALQRKREDEWKERKKGRKANEKAPEDPRVMIREVPVTISCSTLLKRFKNSNGHTLYSFGEELDTLNKTNGAGSWSSKYDIYRMAFDHGKWGQDYNSDQAESGMVDVAYNWSILGTYGALRRCFKRDNIENGLSSRIMLAEMPDNSFASMPHYKTRTADDEARMQEAVTRLRSFTGFVDTPRLRKTMAKWVEEKRVEAAKDIDYVKDTYRKRAAVIGFRCGVISHLLSGNDTETKPCADFAMLMAEYILQEQSRLFGETLLEQRTRYQVDDKRRTGCNDTVFDRLPPTFSAEDIMALKGSQCGNKNSIRMIVHRWKKEGMIVRSGSRTWTKTENNETGATKRNNATPQHRNIKEV